MSPNQFSELLKEFISIKSQQGNLPELKRAVDFVHNLIKDVPNVTVERFESNGLHSFVAYKGKVRPEKFDILLNAHVDVVPSDDKGYQAYEQDGKIYGRGSLDMKGTTLGLMQAFINNVNNVPYTLGLQVVCDEETGGTDGVKKQLKEGVLADFVVIGEYVNKKSIIYNGARGLCWVEVGFKGKSAHGAHLWHGSNAILKAGDFVTNLLKHYPTPTEETWTTTASIASISTGNTTYNKVPDEATVQIDFRFTQEDPVFQTEQALRKFITKMHPEAELLHIDTFENSVLVHDLNPYVQALGHALTEITGQKFSLGKRPGASDGRHFADFNIDIVEFGLYGQGSHSDHEYVEIDSFTEYVQILDKFLQNPKQQANQNEYNNPNTTRPTS